MYKFSSIYSSMDDEQCELLDAQIEDMENCPCGLYVLSNEKQLYGAAAIVHNCPLEHSAYLMPTE